MATVNDHDHPVDLDTQEARQGKELGSVRWVLRVSLALVVLAGIAIYFIRQFLPRLIFRKGDQAWQAPRATAT